ncbi:MAG: hypothetical protein FD161_2986 [Limisphaerales bacterium]|nr:MAG: hypothetical protein FD161_2986 [Limisphaerales bacterium]KAG0508099.1 MAG: hypothetical protein E1N63_2693 [Limisphaerales bacterium]TXT53048.1 MAG: hypothetical protein FD140_156 [Limisphaerales bacterium]
MKTIIALANDTAPLAADQVADFIALENELALDNDGWALLVPFGEHRKKRLAMVGGKPVEETYVQIFADADADVCLANEKGSGLFARLKHALVKRPIYNGHPDIKLYAPETVTVGGEKLIPIGLNDGLRKTARGLEFKPLLVPDGEQAVVRDGCKYPSALFLLKKTGTVRANGDIEVRPFKVASIGLTPFPNISGVDALANAREAAAKQTADKKTQPPNPNMKLIAGWLIANGVTALANQADPTENMVLDAIQKLFTDKTTSVTALGNDKHTLTATVTTLTADRDKEKQRADNATTALANEQTAAKAMHKSRCEFAVDLHIGQGKLAVADRDAEVGRLVALANEADFAKAVTALGALPVKFKTGGGDAGDKKKSGADATRSASEQVLALANEDARYKGKPFTPELYAKILEENPTLKEQLNQAPAAK